jgi:hypothetical protein
VCSLFSLREREKVIIIEEAGGTGEVVHLEVTSLYTPTHLHTIATHLLTQGLPQLSTKAVNYHTHSYLYPHILTNGWETIEHLGDKGRAQMSNRANMTTLKSMGDDCGRITAKAKAKAYT